MSASATLTTRTTTKALRPVPGMLQRKCECGSHTPRGGECEECGKHRRVFQRKLAIGPSSDPLEHEADRVAGQVMSTRLLSRSVPPRIQCFADSEGAAVGEAPEGVERVLSGPGRPLEAGLARNMSERFGYDFSPVRVHADAAADRSAREVNALAYTSGSHIVFGAGRFAPSTPEGQHLLAHELTHVVQQAGSGGGFGYQGRLPITHSRATVRRKCQAELGKPAQECKESAESIGGVQFFFKMGCDDLLPGEDAKIGRLTYGRKLRIHGFASRDGDPSFNESLSCHRANVVADLAARRRPECPIEGRYKHGASPTAEVARKDPKSPDFWRMVVVEEVRPSREEWLDPNSILSRGWTLYRRASNSPTTANLTAAAAHRTDVKGWLTRTPKTLAPQGRQLDRKDLTDYSQLYSSAEFLWKSIDKLLTDQGHIGAKTDTYVQWASGTGLDSGPALHAKHVPAGAHYHIDLFGEGFFQGAVNIGMAERTSTTGVSGSRVPNLIYRKFSASNAAVNSLPIADHAADLVTSENGPLGNAGLIDEIARVVAPGGTIVLYGPTNMERYHDQMAKAVGGTIKKEIKDGGIESIITVPARP